MFECFSDIGGGIGLSSLGISPQNPGSARLRACVESVLLLDLMESLKKGLTDNHLLDAFRKVRNFVINRMLP